MNTIFETMARYEYSVHLHPTGTDMLYEACYALDDHRLKKMSRPLFSTLLVVAYTTLGKKIIGFSLLHKLI